MHSFMIIYKKNSCFPLQIEYYFTKKSYYLGSDFLNLFYGFTNRSTIISDRSVMIKIG